MTRGALINIGCSKVVLNNLEYLGGKNNRLFYEQIDTSIIKTSESRISEIKKELNLDKYKFCWTMAGASSPRKGFDLFIEIAARKPDSCFLWIGKQRDHGYNRVLIRKIEQEGLTNIKLIDQQGEDYFNYLKASDAFLLTSREDPFPLVMIEAAYLSKPIVSFNSGGVVEFMEQDMGDVIDAIDVTIVIDKLSDIENGKKTINHSRLISRAEEFDIQKGIIIWEKLITESVAS